VNHHDHHADTDLHRCYTIHLHLDDHLLYVYVQMKHQHEYYQLI
jgi:hypothetical protein